MEMEHSEIQELDALIDTIGSWMLRDNAQPGLLNPIRTRQLQFVHSVLERMAQETDAAITYTLHEPCKSMGSICVEGKDLEFTDCKWLGRAMEFADNMDIYPTAAGNIRLVLTFHGLTSGMRNGQPG